MTKQPKTIKIKLATLFNIAIGIALTLIVQNTLQVKENGIIAENIAIDANEKDYLEIKTLKQMGFYDN